MTTIKRRLSTKKFESGGWNNFWDKYGDHIGVGVGTAMSKGPITGLIAGISSYKGTREADEAKRIYEEEQKELLRKSTFQADTASFANYANVGKGNRLEGMYRLGGVAGVKGQSGIIVGPSHEEGGVDMGGVNLEGGEAIDGDKVFNRAMAPAAIQLMQVREMVQRKYMMVMNKLAQAVDNLEKSKDKYQQQGGEHKLNAIKKEADAIQQELAEIEKELQKVFQEQQDVNPNPNGQPIDEQGVPISEADMGQEQVQMRLGGKIKGEAGLMLLAAQEGKNYVDSVGGYMVNLAQINKFNKIPLPSYEQSKAYTFDPHVDTSASEAATREAYNRIASATKGSVSNQALSRTLMTDAGIRLQQGLSAVKEGAANAERNIRNTNITNIQQVAEKNIGKKEQSNVDAYNKRMTVIDMQSDALNQMVNDYKQADMNKQLANMDKMRIAAELKKSGNVTEKDIEEIMKIGESPLATIISKYDADRKERIRTKTNTSTVEEQKDKTIIKNNKPVSEKILKGVKTVEEVIDNISDSEETSSEIGISRDRMNSILAKIKENYRTTLDIKDAINKTLDEFIDLNALQKVQLIKKLYALLISKSE